MIRAKFEQTPNLTDECSELYKQVRTLPHGASTRSHAHVTLFSSSSRLESFMTLLYRLCCLCVHFFREERSSQSGRVSYGR